MNGPAKKSRRQLPPQTAPLVASLAHERMLQVLANLIKNASECTLPGGLVEATAEREGTAVFE